MGADSERMRLVIETRIVAEGKIRQLRKELNKLGGAPVLKAQREIKRLTRDIRQLSGASKKGRPIMSRFAQGIAVGNIAAMAAAKAVSLLSKGVEELGRATMVAAQVSELGNVMMFVGQRAGYTKDELEGYRNELLRSGIAQKATNQAMLRALQANIDLKDAVRFGKIAQDAAVVGLTESSDAYMRIVGSIAKLMPRQLKELGIIINLNTVYGKYARTHDKVAAHLSEAEKKQAMVNAVFDKGEVVAGAYEEAMFNVSKRIRSLPRLYQDLQVELGEKFNPLLEVSVALAEELLLDMTKLADTGMDLDTDDAKEDIVELREKARLFMATMVSMGHTMYDAGSVVKNVTELLMLDPIIALGKVGEAVFAALSHPWDVAAWVNAGKIITSAKDGFVGDFDEMQASLDRLLSDAATDELLENAERIGDSMAKMRGQIGVEVTPRVRPEVAPVAIPELLEIEKEFDHMEAGAIESVGKVEWELTAMQGQIVSSVFAMGDAMVDGLMQGRIEMGQIFKGMAADFMKFFVRKALFSIMSSFIPGLGKVLGSMFDTPRYDKMAMQQGEDFARYFREGAMRGMSDVAPTVARAAGAAMPRDERPASTINVYISGNVMAPEFVEAQVAPILKRLIVDGRTALSLDRQNITGDVDIRVD